MAQSMMEALHVVEARRETGQQILDRVLNFRPTPECINGLPEPLRRYLHDLETQSDPAGMVAENILLKDQNAMLQAKLKGSYTSEQVSTRHQAIGKAVNALGNMIHEDAPPSIFLQIATLINAFIWSKESDAIVSEAAIKAWHAIYGEDSRPEWNP